MIANQVKELGELKSLAEEQLSAFGEFGVLKDLFESAAGASLGSKADFYGNLSKFGFDPCAINLCQVGENNANMTDLEEARRWAMQTFYVNRAMSNADRRDIEEVRRRGVIYAATTALALSNTVHTDLVGAGEQAGSLESIVNASQNLRGDVRANSAIQLAAYKVQIQQLALLTALVDVSATGAIASTNPFHDGGSSEIPDAILESDLSRTNASERVRVTPPQRGTASSGGSGFGGGIVGSLLGGSSSPLSSLLKGTPAGDIMGTIGGIAKGGDPFTAIAAGIGGGAIPGISGGVTKDFMMSDALGLAKTVLTAAGKGDIANQIGLVERGVGLIGAAGAGPGAGSRALLGIGGMIAQQSGSGDLSRLMRVAGTALESGNTSSMVDFALGAASDMAGVGNNAAADFLRGQVSKVATGALDPQTLVMDTAHTLAKFSPDANGQVADLVASDTALITPQYMRDLAISATKIAADMSGNKDVGKVADVMKTIDDPMIARLNAAIADAIAAGKERAAARVARESDGAAPSPAGR